ncbi:hypothetical protein CYMTET_29183 [Cymbomonas tetramitiformis]|uniref:Probable magnesium transporter n=1 Tax=Cymbomonas tetramitiformis TaxID=36881 RepID=A0AAE0FLZ6_9CHLO|nr:hypothetical protein CYMTET_29183 [Cymbomonas tetramitiformis]
MSDLLTWCLGVFLVFVANAGFPFSYTCTRLAYLVNDQLPLQQRQPPWRRPLWWLGIVVGCVGGLLNGIGTAIAGLAVAAIGSSTKLLWNAVYGRHLLGESFDMSKDTVGGGCILLGVFLQLLILGKVNSDNDDWDSGEVVDAFGEWYAVLWYTSCGAVYIGLLAILVVAPVYLSEESHLKGWLVAHRQYVWPFAQGIASFLTSLLSNACYRVMMDKYFSSLGYGPFWLFLLSGASLALSDLFCSTTSLSHNHVLLHAPIQMVTYYVGEMLNGGIVFHEFSDFHVTEYVVFIAAACMMATGVVFILQRKSTTVHDGILTKYYNVVLDNDNNGQPLVDVPSEQSSAYSTFPTPLKGNP